MFLNLTRSQICCHASARHMTAKSQTSTEMPETKGQRRQEIADTEIEDIDVDNTFAEGALFVNVCFSSRSVPLVRRSYMCGSPIQWTHLQLISFAIAPVVLLIVHLLKRRSGGAIANESTVRLPSQRCAHLRSNASRRTPL